jgi:rhodanese-related sulfurtransferase
MFKEISNPEVFNELVSKGAIPIDVRTAAECHESKIPNAISGYDWNSGEFHDKMDDFDKSKTYIFICRSGNRSMQACLYMASNGYTHLYNLKGGMQNWTGDTTQQ